MLKSDLRRVFSPCIRGKYEYLGRFQIRYRERYCRDRVGISDPFFDCYAVYHHCNFHREALMGIYPIKCPICEKEHTWFSGSMDQRCEECKIPFPTTPEEIVNLIGNIGNRPDINAVKAVQLRAIKALIEKAKNEISSGSTGN